MYALTASTPVATVVANIFSLFVQFFLIMEDDAFVSYDFEKISSGIILLFNDIMYDRYWLF